MSHVTVSLVGSYDIYFVGLSIAIAAIVAYTALKLLTKITVAQGQGWQMWLARSAIVFVISIWLIHFIATLAEQLAIDTHYNPYIVSVAMLIVILVSGVIAISCQAIIKRKQDQILLKRYQLLSEHARDIVLFVRDDGQIIEANNAAVQAYGYERQELLSLKIYDIRDPQTHLVVAEQMEQADQKGILFETTHCRKDGSTFPVEVSCQSTTINNEKILLSIIRNITERKLAEAEISKALLQEKELNNLKSRVLSIATHEFRTPLSAIFITTELLKNFNNNISEEKRKERLNRIQLAVENMTDMLDEVLNICQAEAGKIEFNPSLFNIKDFCLNIIEEIEIAYQRKQNILFTFKGSHTDVEMDEKLLRQIINNLLSNAIKYSPESSTIDFCLICEEKQITFQVKDRGIGIPEQDKNCLFQAFYRASNVGNISGTGLGLSIINNAVRLHGGSINVESQVGIGTTFTVNMPRLVATAQKTALVKMT